MRERKCDDIYWLSKVPYSLYARADIDNGLKASRGEVDDMTATKELVKIANGINGLDGREDEEQQHH